MGHLAVAALERGDDEWENIQDVLREAFLEHVNRLQRHNERLNACEQHAREGREKWTEVSETLARLQGVPGHVDTLARVVNTLSEELKQRALAEHDRQQQQSKWMESVTRAVETQIAALQSRITTDIESMCRKALASIERRMTLMEEELSHLATALDQKTDVDVFRAHKQVMEEALKQRCRKAAFDKEVVRVQQLVRSQHATMYQRVDDVQKALQQQLDQLVLRQQQDLERLATTETDVQKRCDQLRQDIMLTMTEKVKTLEESTALNVAAEVAAVQEIVTHQVTELVAGKSDELTKIIRDVDTREQTEAMEREWREWRGQAAVHDADLVKQISTLREEMTLSLAHTSDRLNYWQQNQSDRDVTGKQCMELKDEHMKLRIQLDQVATLLKQQVERLDKLESNNQQHNTAIHDELRELARARDKKTRQQMHLVADKLREMDQILKLVGKQLVQNTSQLQLLWIDQHDSSDGLSEDEGGIKLLEPDDVDRRPQEPAQLSATEEGTASTPLVEGVDAEMLNRHKQLQQSIAAKLRDYEAVLSSPDMPTDPIQPNTSAT